MNRLVSQLGDKVHRARAVMLVGIAALISGALVAPPAHALVDVGPIDAATGFPSWYEDASGLSLQRCSAAPECGAVAPEDAPYFSAVATMPATIGVTARLDMDLTGTFVNGVVIAGDQQTGEKLRFEIPKGLIPGQTYTVTFPYGTRTAVADVKGAIKLVETFGCPDAPCDFTEVVRSGFITNYLQWDAAFGAAPTGFIGDGATPHAVTGSPLNTNFFRVTGPAVGGPGHDVIQTNEFVVTGQLANPATFVAPPAPEFSVAGGPGAGEITVSWVAPLRDGGSPLTGFRVYGGDTATALSLIGTVDATTLSFTEGGLSEGTARFYKVSAVNAVGESDLSLVPALSATAFSRPSDPRNLVATPGTGVGQAALSWTAPLSNGGSPLTVYTIYRALGSGAYEVRATVAGDVTTFVDAVLLPVVSYRYTVSASNVAGEGGQTNPVCTRAFPWTAALDTLLPCGTP